MSDSNTSAASSKQHAQPVPPLMAKVINTIMKVLLNSPFHGRISKSLMLLTFTGRKSGRQFTIPVRYLRQGQSVTVFTHSNWWKNLRGGAPVTMRIQGENITGIARPVDDPAEIKRIVRDLIALNGEAQARQMGFWADNLEDSPENVKQAVAGTIFLKIQIDAR